LETLLALEGDQPAAPLVAVCRVTEIFARLSLAYEQQNDDSGHHDLPLKLARVVLWIEQNLDQPLSNTEIADFAHISPRSLSRLFQEIYRETPKEFVARLRFRKACDLLRNSEHNISEISYRCGFSDSNYFSRQFHKVFGCQPRAFRKQQAR
jgi:AraC-like DNA-binding protein